MATMLDIHDGSLRLPGGLALTPDTVADLASLKGFEYFGETNGFLMLASPAQLLWDKSFAVTLRFVAGKLHFIELVWTEGPVARLGYDATEKDLLGEKRQLVAMLTRQLGRAPADTSLGADCFPYPWGVVCACASLKSTACSVVINYVYRLSAP